VVHALLQGWLSWASHSKLPAFVKVARTIRKHLDDIVAYIRWRLTNGVVEGLNTKARVLTRRAYGFHSASAAIAMIMLCCSGIKLRPPGTAIFQPT
jgi:transposase